jgi:hypothetical protein
MAHGLQTHEWYEKNPNRVTEAEFNHLVREFNKSLMMEFTFIIIQVDFIDYRKLLKESE